MLSNIISMPGFKNPLIIFTAFKIKEISGVYFLFKGVGTQMITISDLAILPKAVVGINLLLTTTLDNSFEEISEI